MNFNDYARHDAVGLADLVRRREVSASELAASALAAIERLNPVVNAVVEAWEPDAPLRAAAPTGTLAGVPFLVKDIMLQRHGRKMEMGSRLAEGYVAAHTSFLTTRFDQLGLTTLGRTTTPEFGHGPTSEALLYGPTRNPWGLTRMAGGSSGGAAAAVAAGMVPIAHGGDGAGSIRTPAACCGLIGLKPSRGRVSAGPLYAEGLFGMVADFALTRSVRDTAEMLDGISAPMPGDPFVIMREASSYTELMRQAPRKLRIAFTTEPWFDAPVDAEVIQAVEACALLCERLGHDVVTASPAFDYEQLRAGCITLWAAAMARMANFIATSTGRPIAPGMLESATLAMVRHGQGLSADQVLGALEQVNSVCRAVGPFFEEFDLLITPAIARPPEPLGTYDQNAPVGTHEQWFDRKALFPPFLALFNATGQPCVSLPVATSASGLPIGVQLVGQFGREGQLLQVARQLEEEIDWSAALYRCQLALDEKIWSGARAA